MVAKKKVFQRDGNGRFAKKSIEAGKVEVTKTEYTPTVVSGTDILKMFDRNTGRPKNGDIHILLKVIDPKVPAITRGTYSYIPAQTLNMTHILANYIENYGYLYLGYTQTTGQYAGRGLSLSLPLDYKFQLIDEKHPDYPEVSKLRDELTIKSLRDHLGHNFKIGCDPEIFVEDQDGNLIPAFKFLPGKDNPAKTPSQDKYFSAYGGCPMYWDGYQAEFTTKANHCLGHHGDSIAAGMRGVYEAATAFNPNARLSLRSVFYLDPNELATAEDKHVEFGCMPSFNAYGLKVEMPPARRVPFRSAGGHIHFGVGKAAQKNAEKIIKALDAILGVACVSLFAEFDDPNRRKLYGLPGEYRTPAHGIEYRPLSNAWLCHPMIMNLVIDLSRKCVMFGMNGFMKHWKATEEETINCIINCDVKAAQAILARNKEVFSELLRASYYDYDAKSEILYDVFIKGIRSAIKDPTDFVTNWKLKSGWTPHARAYDGEPNVSKFLYNRRTNSKYKM